MHRRRCLRVEGRVLRSERCPQCAAAHCGPSSSQTPRLPCQVVYRERNRAVCPTAEPHLSQRQRGGRQYMYCIQYCTRRKSACVGPPCWTRSGGLQSGGQQSGKVWWIKVWWTKVWWTKVWWSKVWWTEVWWTECRNQPYCVRTQCQ